MKPLVYIQIIARTLIGLFIFSSEVAVHAILRATPLTYLFFVALIVSAIVLFGLTYRLHDDTLTRDIRELCFYDIVVQCIGLALYFYWSCPPLHIALSLAVFILKFGRLLWPYMKDDGSALVGWPVFGPLGYLRKRMAHAPQTLPLSRSDKMAYVFLLASIPLAFLIKTFGANLQLTFLAVMTLCLLSLFHKRSLSYLYQQHAQFVAANELRIKMTDAMTAKNAELEAINQALVESNRQRDLLVADLDRRNNVLRDASHDLQAPLSWIETCAETYVKQKGDKISGAAPMPLLDAIDNFRGALSNVIEHAKITTVLTGPAIQPIPVAAQASALWTHYQLAAAGQGISLIIHRCHRKTARNGRLVRDHAPVFDALDFMVESDHDILQRILNNLVMNALRHTTQGGILVAFRQRRDNTCWIEVRDSGSGMTGADGPDWAANFANVADMIKYGKKGANQLVSHGLGINNIKNLCAILGIEMMLHSRVGQGSIFRLVLPLAHAAQA
jgi:signal transduction histidine kinase